MVFLLVLASRTKHIELHVFLGMGNWEQVTLTPTHSFLSKIQVAKESPNANTPLVIPALKSVRNALT